MKQSVTSVTINELKNIYASELKNAEKTLRGILDLDNEEKDTLQSGWVEDFYHHDVILNDSDQFELLYLISAEHGRPGAYAIPVVYCNPDGTSVSNGKWIGKKVWTLFLIMSADGEFATEFIPNRYDIHSNMHPDFKSVGYSKNFITQFQFTENGKVQKSFDVQRYLESVNEKMREKEEKRRSALANITVGQLEDFMAEFKEMKEMLKQLTGNK